ncbi:mitochondrial carrier protein, putative [Ichthyophthirius multifiliis]|uniref:Mitochondrial carrier protein, putative n=1 Tax=Ichthyophthirius multifiliis TaxID=5932 RepID=G0QYU6_ICHMU|nr:mitochondrial carrier protein, putative [Ichthyophthirius multifiliis]EGR29621.1 mitochondrial carrier protein, putative [Ichthyophthirius multifiliis]|eukprot:XP_004030857.1 mitochondrial carrier protein, putative [Ichthyophthirius multifiliis]
MISLPHYFQQNIISTDFQQKYKGLHKLIGATMIAFIESFIICPFERLKVYLITQQNKNLSIRNYFQYNFSFKSLYYGIEAQLIKQIVSWISFLYTDFLVKQFFRDNFSQDQQYLSNSQLLVCATITGSVNTLFTHPFDKLKTLYQMQLNQIYLQHNIYKLLKNIYYQQGGVSLYNGWQIRLIQYLIQAVFTSTLLERLEERLHYINNKTVI